MANHTHTWWHHVIPLRTETTRFHNSILPTAIKTWIWTSGRWSTDCPCGNHHVFIWFIIVLPVCCPAECSKSLYVHASTGVGLLCTQCCCAESNYHQPWLCGNKVPCIVYLVICQSSPTHPEPETSLNRPDIWGHSRSQLTQGFPEIRLHVNLLRTPSTLTHWCWPFTRRSLLFI